MNAEAIPRWSAPFKRIIGAILLVCFLAFVLVVCVARTQTNKPKRWTILPDGTRVEVLGAVLGTNSFTTEKTWERVARKILPAKYQKWIPKPFTSISGNWLFVGTIANPSVTISSIFQTRRGNATIYTNRLTVFVRFQNSNTVVASGSGGGYPFARGEAVDADDLAYTAENGVVFTSYVPSGQAAYRVVCLTFQAYPRRQQDFELHLFDSRGAVIARLRVRNPPHPPFPEWRALPLPQSVTNGSVVLTLQRFEQPVSPQPLPNLVWRFDPIAPGWTNFAVRSVTFFDATGNEGPSLSPREPAWKIRTELYCAWGGSVPPPGKLLTSGLAIPSTAEFTAIDQATNLGGVGIKVMLIAGAGELVFHDGVSTNAFPPPIPFQQLYGGWRVIGQEPFVLVEVTDAQFDDDIGFRLRDQQGREIEFEKRPADAAARPAAPNCRLYQLIFKPGTNVQTLTLEAFATRRRDNFEFMVSPKDVQEAKP